MIFIKNNLLKFQLNASLILFANTKGDGKRVEMGFGYELRNVKCLRCGN